MKNQYSENWGTGFQKIGVKYFPATIGLIYFPATMTVDATSAVCNLGILDSLNNSSSVIELLETWNAFCLSSHSLVSTHYSSNSDPSLARDFASQVHILRSHGLQSLIQDHFLTLIQVLNSNSFLFFLNCQVIVV